MTFAWRATGSRRVAGFAGSCDVTTIGEDGGGCAGAGRSSFAGITGGALGLVGLIVAFFAPLGTEGGSTCTDAGCTSYTRAVSYAGSAGGRVGGSPTLVGVWLADDWAGRGRRRARPPRVRRRANCASAFCTVLLGIFTVLGALSVGIFLLPATAFAVAASILAARGPQPDTASVEARPALPGGVGILGVTRGRPRRGRAAVLGGLALYLIVFGLPTRPGSASGGVISSSTGTASGTIVSSPCATAYACLGAVGVLPLLIAAVVPLLAVALGALAHALRRSRAGLVLLWLGTLALLVFGALLTAAPDALPAWVSQLPSGVVYLVPVAASRWPPPP